MGSPSCLLALRRLQHTFLESCTLSPCSLRSTIPFPNPLEIPPQTPQCTGQCAAVLSAAGGAAGSTAATPAQCSPVQLYHTPGCSGQGWGAQQEQLCCTSSCWSSCARLTEVPPWLCPQEQNTHCPAECPEGALPVSQGTHGATLAHREGMLITPQLPGCSASCHALTLCAAHRQHCPRQLLWSPSKMCCQMMNSSARGPRVKTAIMAACAPHAKSTHGSH